MMLLCLGICLGLLTPVHSAPVDNSTHVPVTPVDFINEAVKDGFLLPQALFPSLTTKEPTRNSTDIQIPVTPVDYIQEAVQRGILPPQALFPPPQSPEESSITPTPERFLTSMEDASGDFWPDLSTEVESGVSTTLSVSPTEIFTSTESTRSIISGSLTTESPEESSPSQTPDLLTSTLLMDGSGDSWFEMEDSTSSTISPAQSPTSTDESVINEELSPLTTESPKASTPFTVDGSGDYMLDFTSDAGSGHEGSAGSSLAVSDQAGNVVGASRKGGRSWANVLNGVESSDNPSPEQHRGHSTSDWIIIVGFIVGLAALVMLCAAIATRDKWNGPKVESGDETKTNSANQMRELEMQTFLHKEEPVENGKEAEYTVLSVEDLPSGFAD